jgi:hypothetical protein
MGGGGGGDDDPRRRNHVTRFEAMPQLSSKGRRGQQEPAGSLDFLATLSMLLGVGGMATRAKILAWLALFACLSAGANLRRSDGDARALVGAFMCVCVCECACVCVCAFVLVCQVTADDGLSRCAL